MPKLDKKELAARLARRLALSPPKAESAIDGFLAVVTEALASGDDVSIEAFLELYAEDTPPRVRSDRRTGEKSILPVQRRVKVKVARAFQETTASRSRLKGTGAIVVGAQDGFADDLITRLQEKEIRCLVAGNLKDVLRQAVRVKALDFVVFTPSVPEESYDRAVLQIKERRSSAFLPILRGLFDRTRLERPKGFKLLPDGIFSSAAEVSRQVLSELERWREEKYYFRRQVKVRSASDTETVGSLIEALRRLARGVSRNKIENEKFLNAFPEAIENAAFHGNQASPDKHFELDWLEDARRVMITVKDEGAGFNWEKALATAASSAAEVVRKHMESGKSTGGLGIKLLLAAFDKVSYYDNGSKVVLVKSKSP